MLKFLSSTVGSTTKTITSVLTLVDVQLYVAINESTDDAIQELAKLASTSQERKDLLLEIASA
jgi:hypothetical protein